MDLETRILIVDDDDGIRQLVSSYLEKHGFQTDTAANPVEMREKMATENYDLIVLDVMMPREDGLSAMRKLQAPGNPPVIMLSAVGTDMDRVVGLELGAEDYMAKPCNPRELLARIRAVLRRRQNSAENGPAPAQPLGEKIFQIWTFGGWKMEPVARVLYDPNDSPVTLSDGEFRLLQAFVQHPRRVLTRDQLLEYSRGRETENFDRAIDVQVSRLRRKLSFGGEVNELIRTVRNEGYMFVPSVSRQ
ncbi:MAG TPA: response regulator [Rhizomicrobium sp.]|nr:response regulator [Rhizomicrobium sp.]